MGHSNSKPIASSKKPSEKVKLSAEAPKTPPASRRSARKGSSSSLDESGLSTSPFGKLPPELRNMIYKDLLLEPDNIPWTQALPHTPYLQDLSSRSLKEEHGLLAISRTCEQLQHETLSFYYGSNKFSFSNTNELKKFLQIRKGPRLYTRCINFVFAACDVETTASVAARNKVTRHAAKLLSECQSLKVREMELKHIRKSPLAECNLFTRVGVRELRQLRGLDILKVTHTVPHWTQAPPIWYVNRYKSFDQDDVDHFVELVGEEMLRPIDSEVDAKIQEKKRKKEPDERWKRSLRQRTSQTTNSFKGDNGTKCQ